MRVKIHKKHRDVLLTPSYPYWPSPTGRNPRFQVMRFGGNAVMRLLGRRGGLGWNCAGSLRCPYPGPTEKGQNDCAAIDLTSVFTWNARDSLGFRRKADLSFHTYRREHRHQLSFENFFRLAASSRSTIVGSSWRISSLGMSWGRTMHPIFVDALELLPHPSNGSWRYDHQSPLKDHG